MFERLCLLIERLSIKITLKPSLLLANKRNCQYQINECKINDVLVLQNRNLFN